MTRRLVGLGLLLVAGYLYVGITIPARRARDEARQAFARQRQERERLRADAARLERRASALAPAAPESAAAAARAVRGFLLAATRGLALADVQIAAQPGSRSGSAARGRLVGTGRQADVLRAAERLAEPASGVLLERVDLSLRTEGVRLEAAVLGLRPAS